MIRVFHDEDADPAALDTETVAVLGYGIQGRAQALTLRDSGVKVVVGNREDAYGEAAERDGFAVVPIAEAVGRSTIALLLLPDEVQPEVFERDIRPGLSAGSAIVFAHGFALRYRLIVPPPEVDCLLLAPRLPGQYLRSRFLEGWGIPAFVSVEHDATGRAWRRLLGLASAMGITRCGALEVSAAEETELDHFSEHFTYPLVFHALEIAFETLVGAGYAPEAALMELHGSGELGQVLSAASREGLYGMIASHASPACQVGISHHWNESVGSPDAMRQRAEAVVDAIRGGRFARHLLDQQSQGYPELNEWRAKRPASLDEAERRLRARLRGPVAAPARVTES